VRSDPTEQWQARHCSPLSSRKTGARGSAACSPLPACAAQRRALAQGTRSPGAQAITQPGRRAPLPHLDRAGHPGADPLPRVSRWRRANYGALALRDARAHRQLARPRLHLGGARTSVIRQSAAPRAAAGHIVRPRPSRGPSASALQCSTRRGRRTEPRRHRNTGSSRGRHRASMHSRTRVPRLASSRR